MYYVPTMTALVSPHSYASACCTGVDGFCIDPVRTPNLEPYSLSPGNPKPSVLGTTDSKTPLAGEQLCDQNFFRVSLLPKKPARPCYHNAIPLVLRLIKV